MCVCTCVRMCMCMCVCVRVRVRMRVRVRVRVRMRMDATPRHLHGESDGLQLLVRKVSARSTIASNLFAAHGDEPVAIALHGPSFRVDRAVPMDILRAEAMWWCGAARAVRRGAAWRVRRSGAVRCGAVRASRRMLGMSTMESSGYGGP